MIGFIGFSKQSFFLLGEGNAGKSFLF